MEMNGLRRMITENLYRLDMAALCAEKGSAGISGGPRYRIAYFNSRIRLLNMRAVNPEKSVTELLFSTKDAALRELTGGTEEACTMLVRTIGEIELGGFKGCELHIAGSYITPDAEEEKPYAFLEKYSPVKPSADEGFKALARMAGLETDLEDEDCTWELPFDDDDDDMEEEKAEECVLFFGTVTGLKGGMYTCTGKEGVIHRFPLDEKNAGYSAGMAPPFVS